MYVRGQLNPSLVLSPSQGKAEQKQGCLNSSSARRKEIEKKDDKTLIHSLTPPPPPTGIRRA